jgi:hypothetical protein
MAKLKKRFVWKNGIVEIRFVDWGDGTPLGYVWVGTKKQLHEKPTYDFDLTATQAVTLAKNILAAAKKAGIAV